MKALKNITFCTALALIGLSATNSAYGQSSYAATGDNRVTQADGGCEGVEINTSVNESLCNSVGGVIQSSLTAVQEGATYQWLDCNNGNVPIPNATSQTFVVRTNGSYAVRITLNGCTATSVCKTVNCNGGSGGGGCEGVVINTEVSQDNNGGVITLTAVQQTGATYQWYQWVGNNSEPIANATSHTFSPTADGYYAVVITIGNCTANSEWKTVTTTTGTDKVLANFITIYPNPVQDELRIETGGLNINSVEICDLMGRVIKTHTRSLQDSGNYSINVSSLSAGVYLVKAGIKTAKFVKK